MGIGNKSRGEGMKKVFAAYMRRRAAKFWKPDDATSALSKEQRVGIDSLSFVNTEI